LIMNSISLDINDKSFFLLAEKALFIKEDKLLVISDAHFGKVTHFRKHGYAVSNDAILNNFERLKQLISEFGPERIVFLGDLFHSDYNREWASLAELLKSHSSKIRMLLVPGNHDRLAHDKYHSAGIEMVSEKYHFNKLIFSHEPMPGNEISRERINISGHIHPGVRLVGKGKQSRKLPCFFLRGKSQLILPAFGVFTGLYKLEPAKGDRVFVLADGGVYEVPVE